MPPKNRTKRKHAALRRERRAAFFSASKTTRGEWEARAHRRPPLAPGRTYDRALGDFFATSLESCNRQERREQEMLGRRELRRFLSGRWAKDFACNLRKFCERNGHDLPNPRVSPRRRGKVYEFASAELTFADGQRIDVSDCRLELDEPLFPPLE